MDGALAAVAEGLAYELGELRGRAAVDVVTDCVEEYVYDGAQLVQEAVKARLSILRSPQRLSMTAGRDALDVSLHDGDLADEVELTVRLIVAANDSDRPLAQYEVDDLLEVKRGPSPRWRSRSPRTETV